METNKQKKKNRLKKKKIEVIKNGQIVKIGKMNDIKGDESLEKVFLELDEENFEK